MRVIRLCCGAGNGVDQACLLTAANMVMGFGEQLDKNSCVCPSLRNFIMSTNDIMPHSIRSELYTPLIWEIIGTNTGDKEVEEKRARFMFEECVKLANKYTGTNIEFGQRIDNVININQYIYEICSKYQSILNTLLSSDCKNKINHISACCGSIISGINEYLYETRIDSVYIDEQKEFFTNCVRIIRDTIKIGDNRPVETVLTHDELGEKLGYANV